MYVHTQTPNFITTQEITLRVGVKLSACQLRSFAPLRVVNLCWALAFFFFFFRNKVNKKHGMNELFMQVGALVFFFFYFSRKRSTSDGPHLPSFFTLNISSVVFNSCIILLSANTQGIISFVFSRVCSFMKHLSFTMMIEMKYSIQLEGNPMCLLAGYFNLGHVCFLYECPSFVLRFFCSKIG